MLVLNGMLFKVSFVIFDLYSKVFFPNLQDLSKPPVKEQTKPLNVKLRTESRAAERAKFDNFVCLNPLIFCIYVLNFINS